MKAFELLERQIVLKRKDGRSYEVDIVACKDKVFMLEVRSNLRTQYRGNKRSLIC